MSGGRKRPMPRWLDATLAAVGLVLAVGALVLRVTRDSREGYVVPVVTMGVALVVLAAVVLLSRRYGPPEP